MEVIIFKGKLFLSFIYIFSSFIFRQTSADYLQRTSLPQTFFMHRWRDLLSTRGSSRRGMNAPQARARFENHRNYKSSYLLSLG